MIVVSHSVMKLEISYLLYELQVGLRVVSEFRSLVLTWAAGVASMCCFVLFALMLMF